MEQSSGRSERGKAEVAMLVGQYGIEVLKTSTTSRIFAVV